MTAEPHIATLPEAGASALIHASAVALDGRAVLIVGASGSGKSALALQLMAFGAVLVADDQCALDSDGRRLTVRAPAAIRGMIEARGIGLLRAETQAVAYVGLVVDLDRAEDMRLPPERTLPVLGHRVALFHRIDAPHLAASIVQFLKAGRVA